MLVRNGGTVLINPHLLWMVILFRSSCGPPKNLVGLLQHLTHTHEKTQKQIHQPSKLKKQKIQKWMRSPPFPLPLQKQIIFSCKKKIFFPLFFLFFRFRTNCSEKTSNDFFFHLPEGRLFVDFFYFCYFTHIFHLGNSSSSALGFCREDSHWFSGRRTEMCKSGEILTGCPIDSGNRCVYVCVCVFHFNFFFKLPFKKKSYLNATR